MLPTAGFYSDRVVPRQEELVLYVIQLGYDEKIFNSVINQYLHWFNEVRSVAQ
jgi:hypothetical protein